MGRVAERAAHNSVSNCQLSIEKGKEMTLKGWFQLCIPLAPYRSFVENRLIVASLIYWLSCNFSVSIQYPTRHNMATTRYYQWIMNKIFTSSKCLRFPIVSFSCDPSNLSWSHWSAQGLLKTKNSLPWLHFIHIMPAPQMLAAIEAFLFSSASIFVKPFLSFIAIKRFPRININKSESFWCGKR